MSFAEPRLPRHGRSRSEVEPDATGVGAGSARSHSERPARPDAPAVERPRGSSYRRSIDWEHVGLVGAGLLVGALIGAGTALLLAPQSGQETRTLLRRKARRARHRATDAWDDLAGDLVSVAHRGGRRARRALRRARWRASDAID